ncbi:hypothetical protein TNCV_8711 [Trichonephila clavipes]|nr:hypothetical protein TNCV_8711 [Trichonephila clavipes]
MCCLHYTCPYVLGSYGIKCADLPRQSHILEDIVSCRDDFALPSLLELPTRFLQRKFEFVRRTLLLVGWNMYDLYGTYLAHTDCFSKKGRDEAAEIAFGTTNVQPRQPSGELEAADIESWARVLVLPNTHHTERLICVKSDSGLKIPHVVICLESGVPAHISHQSHLTVVENYGFLYH